MAIWGDFSLRSEYTNLFTYSTKRFSASGAPPCSKQTDNAPKLRFSATLGQEPEIDLTLI